MQPRRRSRELTAGIICHTPIASDPALPPGKGARHGNALRCGQRHTGKEEKTLERRTEKQPAGRHAGGTARLSLPNAPGSSMDLCGTRAVGYGHTRMHLLVQQRGLLTPRQGVPAGAVPSLGHRDGDRGISSLSSAGLEHKPALSGCRALTGTAHTAHSRGSSNPCQRALLFTGHCGARMECLSSGTASSHSPS